MKFLLKQKQAMLITCIFEITWALFIYYFSELGLFKVYEYWYMPGLSYPPETWLLFIIIAFFGGIIPFCFTED